MWIIEFFTLFFILGIFVFLAAFIGFIQIIQMIFGFLMFVLLLPFAMIGTMIGFMIRKIKNWN